MSHTVTITEAHEIIRWSIENQEISSSELVSKQQASIPPCNYDADSLLKALSQVDIQIAKELQEREPA